MKEQKPSSPKAMERGPKPKFHKVKTLSVNELQKREMEEYE